MLRLATQTFSINIAEVPLRAKTKATSCSPRPADRPTRSCIPRTKGLQAADPLFAECIRKRGTRSRRRSFPCRRFVRNNKLNRYSKLMEDAQYSMNVLNIANLTRCVAPEPYQLQCRLPLSNPDPQPTQMAIHVPNCGTGIILPTRDCEAIPEPSGFPRLIFNDRTPNERSTHAEKPKNGLTCSCVEPLTMSINPRRQSPTSPDAAHHERQIPNPPHEYTHPCES